MHAGRYVDLVAHLRMPPGNHNRGLTIEVTSGGLIVQCRGFANREPYPNEMEIVQLWAREHGLRLD
jgi:hypothetical protein